MNKTPYTPGSVIPHNAVIPAPVAMLLSLISFAINATAKHAPPTATLAGAIPVQISGSDPTSARSANTTG
ncbi:hypothetical protein SDC9_206487 [bioreactor metagenome]|uniref:Uncharacterized protein n=1 Tax=bioreactor metagenome TaxID=1076179 RepID=A0A645JGR3_9ZZZZ